MVQLPIQSHFCHRNHPFNPFWSNETSTSSTGQTAIPQHCSRLFASKHFAACRNLTILIQLLDASDSHDKNLHKSEVSWWIIKNFTKWKHRFRIEITRLDIFSWCFLLFLRHLKCGHWKQVINNIKQPVARKSRFWSHFTRFSLSLSLYIYI